MLKDYFTPDVIALQLQVTDWRQAVRAGGELLLRAGKCEARYVDAMIKAVEDMGPYMVLAPGLALAHSRPEDGALQMGMSIITLATPVEFGSEENDPVQLVISLCAVDKKSHIGMLQELAEFLVEPANQALLKQATSIEEVMRAFSRL